MSTTISRDLAHYSTEELRELTEYMRRRLRELGLASAVKP